MNFDFNSKYITAGPSYSIDHSLCYLNKDNIWINQTGQMNSSYMSFDQIVTASKIWKDWVRLK